MFDVAAALATSIDINRYTYTGREFDEEVGLYQYRARMYDAISGRFCSRDPIGSGDGMNLYRAYFIVNAIDPSGMQTDDPFAPGPPTNPFPGGGANPPGQGPANPAAGPGMPIPVFPAGPYGSCRIQFDPGRSPFPFEIPIIPLPLPDVGCYSFTYGRSQYSKVDGPALTMIELANGGCNGVGEAEVDAAARLLFNTANFSLGCAGGNDCAAGESCNYLVQHQNTRRRVGTFPSPIISLGGLRPCIAIVTVRYQEESLLKVGHCCEN